MTEQRRVVQPDWDDVQGHAAKANVADAETAEGDTEGHGARVNFADAETADGDDVEGHMMQVPERDELNHQRLR